MPTLRKLNDGSFNIAIASFTEIAGGRSTTSERGRNLAHWLETLFQEDKPAYPQGTVLQIWGPDLTGNVQGVTPQERAANAEALAAKIHANIRKVNDSLNSRAQALSRFTVGLSYFSDRDYQNAYTAFQEANSVANWPPSQGKEVVYLFLGNAALNTNAYQDAEGWFQKALQVNAAYSRAYLGMGFTLFQESLLPVKNKTDTHINQALLERSIAQFQNGLTAQDKPGGADIDWKAHFGLGRAYLAKGNSDPAHQEALYDRAAKELGQVTAAYEAGKVQFQELAAQSYAQLGLVNYLEKKDNEAIADFQKALAIGQEEPFREEWARKLSAIYEEHGDHTAATQVYLTAVPADSLSGTPVP